MNKTEFIQECTMRNVAAMFSRMYTHDCCEDEQITNAVNAAKKAADLIYGKD